MSELAELLAACVPGVWLPLLAARSPGVGYPVLVIVLAWAAMAHMTDWYDP